jgi:F-type H+-transporting ATPase subunit epsilon
MPARQSRNSTGRERQSGGLPPVGDEAVATFELILNGSRQSERIAGVESFVGEDPSGNFGLKARHERFMTVLVFGLARFRLAGRPWEYLAVPGGLLYFDDNRLAINTRRYLRDSDYNRISRAVTEELLKEEEILAGLKRNLRRVEEAMLKRLLELERGR